MIIDPTSADAAVKLAVSLTEATAKNTVSMIISKREKAKVNRDKDITIKEYEEIIDRLIDDNRDFEQIAKSYKALYEQIEITPENLAHLQKTIERVLLITSKGMDEEQEQNVKMILELITTDTLKTMQLLGYNYKRAIGEPLTDITAKLIRSMVDTPSVREQTVLRIDDSLLFINSSDSSSNTYYILENGDKSFISRDGENWSEC